MVIESSVLVVEGQVGKTILLEGPVLPVPRVIGCSQLDVDVVLHGADLVLAKELLVQGQPALPAILGVSKLLDMSPETRVLKHPWRTCQTMLASVRNWAVKGPCSSSSSIMSSGPGSVRIGARAISSMSIEANSLSGCLNGSL